MKLTKDNLKKYLAKIDYTIKGATPNRFIIDNENKNTGIRVWNETIDFNMKNGIRAVAVFDKCTIKMLSKNTLMIGNGGLFIQLHNFKIK
jgi:hypothetical protein